MPQAAEGELARRRRVLVATPFPPRLDGRHGGSRAIAQLLAALAAQHDVALVALRAAGEPGVDDVLRAACDVVDEVEIPPVGRSSRARLAHRIRLWAALLRGIPTWVTERSAPAFGERLETLIRDWKPDIVQLEYRIMGRYLPAQSRHRPPWLLVEVDPVSADSARRGLLGWLEGRAWESVGRTVFARADSLVVLTEHDHRTVARLSGSTPIARIPLGYALPAQPLDPTGRDPHGIVCIGSFVHPPNVDAALWLANEIFPAVEARVRGASLALIGSHAPRSGIAVEPAGVKLMVDVPDVRPYLDEAAVVAVPIRRGGGMRIKVMEALAAGKAIVATPLALEGLNVTDGKHVVVAETTAEFADALTGLLSDPTRRTAIAKAARAWAERNLDISREVLAYDRLYDSLLGGLEHPGRTVAGWR
jgi:glycosyltransferase involved in cell wall biosynthesis